MLILRQRLKAVMKPDSHAVNGQYDIRSLYFDNIYDKALREKLDGTSTSDESEGSARPGNSGSSTSRPSSGDFNFGSGSMGSRSGNSTGWTWILVSVAILAVGIIIAKKYKY